MVPYAGKTAEKDYRPAQLSEDGYCAEQYAESA